MPQYEIRCCNCEGIIQNEAGEEANIVLRYSCSVFRDTINTLYALREAGDHRTVEQLKQDDVHFQRLADMGGQTEFLFCDCVDKIGHCPCCEEGAIEAF